MDPKVRSTLLEMNRKRGIRAEVLKRSHEKVKKVSRGLKAKLKIKELCKTVKDVTSNVPECSVECTRSFCTELFPFYGFMKKYKIRKYLLADFIAGLTVGIIHIPQGKLYIYHRVSYTYTTG